jgi:hypothetical protein
MFRVIILQTNFVESSVPNDTSFYFKVESEIDHDILLERQEQNLLTATKCLFS